MPSPVKHPQGLWILAVVGGFYCFAFGTITSLLVLYLSQTKVIPTNEAYNLFAALNALLFILPLAGGYLSEKLGYKLAVIVGFITMLIATCSLTIPHSNMIIVGVACFAAGNALITPSTYALVGLHYDDNSILRNSAYTLYYLLINLGFFSSTLLAGFISEHSFYTAFSVSAASTFLAMMTFIFFFHKFTPTRGNSFAPQVPWHFLTRLLCLISFMLILALASIFLLHHIHLNNIIFFTLTGLVSLCLLMSALRQKDLKRRRKMIAFLILCIFSVAFWSLYMLEPSLVAVFISTNVDRTIGDLTIPASSYYSLDAFFVIILGFFFSWLWHHLAKKNKEPSLPTKFSASLLSMGLGYLIFVFAILLVNSTTHLANSFWIVAGYVFLASAELLISPIGISMVGQLMPKGREGLGVGIWQTYTGLSGVISGYLANLAVVPTGGLPQNTNPIFMHALLKIGLGTFVTGLIMCCFTPKIKPLIGKD